MSGPNALGAPACAAWRAASFSVFLSVLLSSVLGFALSSAAQGRSAALPVIVVRHDPGGAIDVRAREIAILRERRAQVEIRGDCWSSCTMYLGLPDTCVSRNAVLGFHGPSSPTYGIGLSPAEFEHWSQVMADHYPEALREWFMRTGRMTTTGFQRFRGADLIRLGIRPCRN